MGASMVGYTIGSFVMALAVTMIVQFILNKIPPLKRRLHVSYGAAYVFGVLLLAASGEFVALQIIVGIALSVTLLWLYRRDVAKLAA